MRSVRVGRIASLSSILLLALASSGCPQLNRQPDYMGNQLMSIDDPLPAIAAVQPASPAATAFDHGNIILIAIKGDSRTRRAVSALARRGFPDSVC